MLTLLLIDICEGSRSSIHSSTLWLGLHQVKLSPVFCHAEGVSKYTSLCLFGNARIIYACDTPDMYCTSVMMYVLMHCCGYICCSANTPLANSFLLLPGRMLLQGNVVAPAEGRRAASGGVCCSSTQPYLCTYHHCLYSSSQH